LENNTSMLSYKGPAALAVMDETELRQQWNNLYQQCTWATVFQSPSYASIWYNLYQQYTPLIIVEFSDNQLVGVFPLALSPSGKLVAAGDSQAEYHGWLATPEFQKTFFIAAVQLLQREFANHPLHLKYLHHLVPIRAVLEDPAIKNISSWRVHQQPVMKIDEVWLNTELKKKNRKEKINRLKRLGNLSFEKVDSSDRFIAILDELIIQSDFRKGAMYGEEFFALDKNKKTFMIQLFQQGLLHVTVLKLNEEFIAANAGVYDKGVVFLQGLSSHSPFHAKYSPGIIRFLMLGLQMHQEGLNEFDLTPGGTDGYKTDLATNVYETHELVIATRAQVNKLETINKSKALIKKVLPNGIGGMTKLGDIRQAKHNLKKKTNALLKFGLAEYTRKKNWQDEPLKNVNVHVISRPQENASKISVSKNSLSQLLQFDETASVATRREFLSNTMKRLEFGHQVYTFVADGKLSACLWLVPKDSKIELPTVGKAEFTYCFPTILRVGTQPALQSFFTACVEDIFQHEVTLEKLTFKIGSGYFRADQLLNPTLPVQ
jgi:CelD/BcsL family acetyltransferase involved in cellulose biosynthesis